jgi:hypothetical protein
MKVQLAAKENGTFGFLARHLEMEGDSIVTEGGDVLISDKPVKGFEGIVIGSHREFDRDILGYLIPQVSDKEPLFFLSKYFDESFHPQVVLGIPLPGLMNGNLGPKVSGGCAIRYLTGNDKAESYYNSTELELLLKNCNYKGFVSFLIDSEGVPSGIILGVPYYGLYAILEGLLCEISEFFKNPHEKLFSETWAVSIAVSKYPYPFKHEARSLVIKDVPFSMEKHFWFNNDVKRIKESFHSNKTLIGIATAWDHTLKEAAGRALVSSWALNVAEKQFRTDIPKSCGYRVPLIKKVLGF